MFLSQIKQQSIRNKLSESKENKEGGGKDDQNFSSSFRPYNDEVFNNAKDPLNNGKFL